MSPHAIIVWIGTRLLLLCKTCFTVFMMDSRGPSFIFVCIKPFFNFSSPSSVVSYLKSRSSKKETPIRCECRIESLGLRRPHSNGNRPDSWVTYLGSSSFRSSLTPFLVLFLSESLPLGC